MIEKRGQLTLFVIIGVVIVIGVGGAYFLVSNDILGNSTPPEYSDLDNTIDDCVKQRTVDSLWLIGLGGGYVNSEEPSISTPFGNTAYGLKEGKNLLISKEKIEKEIEDYVIFSLPYCYDPNDYTYEITSENPKSEVKIYDDYIRVIGEIELTIKNNDTTKRLEQEYIHDIPIRLGRIHKFANEVVEKQRDSGDYIPLTYISDSEFQILFDYLNDDTIFYIIHDNRSKVDNVTFNFLFAAELTPLNGGDNE